MLTLIKLAATPSRTLLILPRNLNTSLFSLPQAVFYGDFAAIAHHGHAYLICFDQIL